MKKIILFPLLLLIIQLSEAQEYLYKNYSTSEGLSSSEVYDISQDKYGYIWFATDRGLTSFDGYDFKKYDIKDGLEDLVILNFYEQKDGTILCSSYNKKLFFINSNKDLFTPYRYNDLLRDITGAKIISNLIIDKEGSLIISLKYSTGYIKINNKGEIINKSHSCDRNTVPIKIENKYPFFVNSENEHNKDNSFLDTVSERITYKCESFIQKIDSDQFLIIDGKNFHLINQNNKSYKYINENKFIAIGGKYDEEHFWVGLRYGGGKIYTNEGKLKLSFLPNKNVTKIFKDHEGGLWLSTTESGVYYINNLAVKTHNIPSVNKEVLTLTKNNRNQLYVGYDSGELYKRQNNNFEKIWQSEVNMPVRVQYNKKTDRLFIQSNHLSEEKLNTINVLYPDKYGRVLSDNQNRFLLTTDKIISDDNKDDYLFLPKTVDDLIIKDIDYADDGYYIGALSGLYQYKKDSLYDLRSKNSLFSSRIDDIDQVGDRYYFASLGQGLLVKDHDTVYAIDTNDGLSSNLITEIYAENEKEIYVATNNGVNKISYDDYLENYSVSSFTILDGLPCSQINDVEVVKDTLWVATKNGLYSFSKSLFESKTRSINKDWLQIKHIQVNNNRISNFESLEVLEYHQNTIEIEFTAISFKKRNNLFYRYRLLGLESGWNTTLNKSVKYVDLVPGKYIFEVQTKGVNNFWNLTSVSTNIIIQYPFWKTWWFYSVLVIAVVLIIYSFFKLKILLYNKDVFKELMLFILKKISGKKHYIIIKESGVEIKLNTSNIYYAKSAGNYLEIYTVEKVYIVRLKIGDFEKSLPDTVNFLRVHRSYLIRKDKIEKKNSKWVQINGETIPVSRKNKEKIEEIVFY